MVETKLVGSRLSSAANPRDELNQRDDRSTYERTAATCCVVISATCVSLHADH